MLACTRVLIELGISAPRVWSTLLPSKASDALNIIFAIGFDRKDYHIQHENLCPSLGSVDAGAWRLVSGYRGTL